MAYKLTYKELLVELKFVSQIPKEKVVDLKSHRFQERGTWSTTIARWWNSQNRGETIKWLEAMINQTENFINNLKDIERDSLLKTFKNAIPGIKNMANTYKDEDEPYTWCKIDAIHDEAVELIKRYDPTFIIEEITDNSKPKPRPKPRQQEEEYYDE